MKKIILLLIPLLFISGCNNDTENKKRNSQFDDYTLKIKGSEICEFKDLSIDTSTIIKSYCIDSILVTDKNDKSYELKDLLETKTINIDDITDGLVIKEEIKDGSLVLYKEKYPEYNIIKCAESYPNDYVIVNFMEYHSFFCEL